MKRLSSAFALVAMASLTACGGGSGTGSALPAAAKTSQMQDVQFRITIPQSARLSPKYISSSTQSAAITVTPSGAAPLTPVNVNCTSSCSGTVSAPVGSDQFTVNLYDATNATGHVLSTGTATQTIVAGTANSVTLTFGGVVASIAIALASSTISSAGTVGVTVTAKDAANQTIVGSAAYNNAITLTDTDASGATSLSTTNVSSPASSVSLTYSGASTFVSAVIGASAAGVASSAVAPATLTKAGGGATVPAAFMAQTSATKTSATVAAGSASGIAVAISGAPDQAGSNALNLAPLTFGTGSSALSASRRVQDNDRGHFGGPHGALDRSPDVAVTEALLRTMGHTGGSSPGVRATRSVLPSSMVPGASANIWVHASTYVAVASTLEYNSTHGHIWVDNSLISGPQAVAAFGSGSIAATTAQIGADFDNAYSSDTAHFGTPDYPTSAPGAQLTYNACDSTGTALPGAAGTASQYIPEPADGMVNVMVLNPALLGGFGGYFSATNFLPQSILNCSNGSSSPHPIYSNEAPFIFVGWFNGNGSTYELQEDLVRGTAHEFQHFINFINHSILATGANSYSFAGHEDSFINEGMSMLSQDFAVHQMRPAETFDSDDALYNASYYISHPDFVALTAHYGKDSASGTAQSGCSACYGGDYLFQRYMYDRFGGDAYIKGMTTSGITGFSNLVQNASVSGETANQLLADFGMALAVNATGVAPPNTAFKLGTLNLGASYPGLSAPNTLPTLGFAQASLAANASASVSAPVGGFAFVPLSGIPGTGEPVTINDGSSGGSFALVGGLVQH